MTKDDVMALLRKKVEEAGTAKAFAEANDISAPYLSDVLKGYRLPADAVLNALGLEKVVTYREKV